MAHAQKPDLVFQGNGRVHLNRRGCQFSRLLAVEECGSAGSDCIDRVPTYSARLLATHSIRIFPLHFSSRASPCAIRFRTSSFILCCSVTGRDTQLTATGAQDSYCYMRYSTHCSRDKHFARPLINKKKWKEIIFLPCLVLRKARTKHDKIKLMTNIRTVHTRMLERKERKPQKQQN